MIYSQLANYYDVLMTLDYTEYMMKWQQLVDFTGQDVFEFGCGTGNVTEKLLPLVNSIDAADASSDMLMLARQKLSSPKLRFFLIDQDFSIERNYDKIGLFIDVVNYLPKNTLKRFLSVWKNKLKPGGEILFDVSNEYKLSQVLGDQIFHFETDRDEIYWINDYNASSKQLDFSLVIYHQIGDGLYERHEEFHTQYVYTENDIKQLAPDYTVSRYCGQERDLYILRKKTT